MAIPSLVIPLLAGILLLSGSGVTGCGYSFQNSHNPLEYREGIRRVYVSPVINNTYKPGVENLVYNQLIRIFSSHRRVAVVQDPEQADAVLQGTVVDALYAGGPGTTVINLNPQGLGQALPTAPFVISTIYTANLNCAFSLIRRNSLPGKKGIVWASSFARSKQFPASNQLDVPGTTSALINESEFDRALQDLAHSMMDDLHESMLAMF
jgi:hypothetical protein